MELISLLKINLFRCHWLQSTRKSVPNRRTTSKKISPNTHHRFGAWPEIRDSQRAGTRFHKFSSFACWLEDFERRHAFLINIHKAGGWLAPSKFMHSLSILLTFNFFMEINNWLGMSFK
jgi:hypothetical protein